MPTFQPSNRKIEEYEPLPLGRYWVKGVKAEDRQTQAGDGWYIAVDYVVTRGEYKGRPMLIRYNTKNANEVTVDIAREQLTLWAAACGRPGESNVEALLNLEFETSIGKEKDSDRRRIAGFYRNGKQLRFEQRKPTPPAWSDNAREARAKEAAAKPAASAEGAPPSEANPPPPLDDDIPC